MQDITQLKTQIQDILSPIRFRHTVGVMETAVLLAKKYHVNVQKAQLAALLHDVAKDYPDEQLLQMAHEYGLDTDIVLEKFPALLHGPVGAALARQKLGITERDILQAVAVHTFGDVNLTDTAKILMVADAIEPGRLYKGIEGLRQQIADSGDSLNQATLHCLEFKIQTVLKCKYLLHPTAINARNELLLKVN
ncbi:MAG: HD domain-containing protein [Firmicutes bacterium]|nr:HD domain-containing protein [Bacillota bacterium]